MLFDQDILSVIIWRLEHCPTAKVPRCSEVYEWVLSRAFLHDYLYIAGGSVFRLIGVWYLFPLHPVLTP